MSQLLDALRDGKWEGGFPIHEVLRLWRHGEGETAVVSDGTVLRLFLWDGVRANLIYAGTLLVQVMEVAEHIAAFAGAYEVPLVTATAPSPRFEFATLELDGNTFWLHNHSFPQHQTFKLMSLNQVLAAVSERGWRIVAIGPETSVWLQREAGA